MSDLSEYSASGRRLTDYSSDILHRLFEAMSDGVVVFDEQGRVTACNAGMALICGRSIEDLIGTRPMDWCGYTPWCDSTEALTSSEGCIVRPDGRVRRVTVKGFMVPGNPPCRAAVYRDVTSHSRPSTPSGESQDQGRHLLENVNDGIVIHRNGTIAYVNERLAGMLGYERRELLLRPVTILHASQDPRNIPAVGAPPTRRDTVYRRRDGSLLDVEVSVSTSIHEGQEAMFEVVRDVTERKRMEQRAAAFLALGEMLSAASNPREAALAMLRAADGLMPFDSCTLDILDASREILMPILYMDTFDGGRVEVEPVRVEIGNAPMARRVLEEGPQLVLRRSAAESSAEGFQAFGNTARASMSLMFVPIRSVGGTVGVVSLQSYRPNAYTGSDLEVLQALVDYCGGALERARVVADLKESEARYREMFQGNGAIQLILSPNDGRVLEANEGAVTFYGYSQEAFLSEITIFRLAHVAEEEEVRRQLLQGLEAHRGFLPMRHRLADGTLRDVELYCSPVTVHGRRLIHAIIQDVTERNRAVERGRAIAELGHRLSAAVSPSEVARVVLEIAQRLIGWDASFLDLISSEFDTCAAAGKLLVPVIHCDTVDGQVREVPPVMSILPIGSVSHRVVQEGPQLILRRKGEAPGPEYCAYGDVSRPSASLMYVPIVGTSGALGILSLQSYSFDAYTDEHLTVLQTLADHCSGALERTRAEEQVRLLESAVRLATDMVVISAFNSREQGGTQIIFVNEAFIRHTGWTRAEIIGRSSSLLHGPLTDQEEVARLRNSLIAGRPVTVEMVNYRKDGTPYDVEFSAFPIATSSGGPQYFVSVQRDVTERRHAQRQLAWRAFHDPLTALPNRSLFRERLEHAMARRQRSSDETFAVLYLDLDTFKEVNDNFGHAAGDQVLVQVARRLESCVRPGDTVSRLGGDEFILLLERTDNLDDVLGVAERILSTVREPIDVGPATFVCGTSIGIAPPDLFLIDPDEIIRRADEALYRAKSEGKGRYCVAGAEV